MSAKKRLEKEEEPLVSAFRKELRSAMERVLRAELRAALDAEPYARSEERKGYRHGSEERGILTSLGPSEFKMPRGRIKVQDGTEEEWRSFLIGRYQRRTRDIDLAIMELYLAGVNTRRIKKALRPLLGNAELSASTVSRIVSALKEHFETWRKRSLAEEDMRYLYLDGFSVKVRVAGRCSRVSILAAVGVNGKGEKKLMGLWLKGSESAQAWSDALEDMIGRGLKAPLLVIIDGGKGLRRAVEECWPKTAIQRCTVHKLRNLLAILPKRAHKELKTDYRRIINAFSLSQAREAYKNFTGRWRSRSPEVVKSLAEAGTELLTFYYFPDTQWRSLRSTNVIERLYGEFRRRVKTQGALPTEEAVLALLYGLVATGQIVMRKMTGYENMPDILPAELDKAA